jgi:iron complex transport system substrate-binding protein
METLERLDPDLIVTQALCDVCAVAEAEVRDAACMLPSGPRVLNLEPETLDQVLACIHEVAVAAGVPRRADPVIARLRARVDAVTDRAGRRSGTRPRVALLEWLDPPFSSGHWNPQLVRLAGGEDGLGGGREGLKSVTLEWQQVIAWQPEVVVIACCGFTAERTMQEIGILNTVPGWDDVPAVREGGGRVYVTDGASYFSRPGPRLVDSLELLAHVIDPAVHPLPPWVQPPVRLRQHAGAHQ